MMFPPIPDFIDNEALRAMIVGGFYLGLLWLVIRVIRHAWGSK